MCPPLVYISADDFLASVVKDVDVLKLPHGRYARTCVHVCSTCAMLRTYVFVLVLVCDYAVLCLCL